MAASVKPRLSNSTARFTYVSGFVGSCAMESLYALIARSTSPLAA